MTKNEHAALNLAKACQEGGCRFHVYMMGLYICDRLLTTLIIYVSHVSNNI